MSRVEPNQNPSERRGSEQLRQAERGRNSESRRQEPSNLSRNPSQAEGEESAVDEALKHGNR
ncbi:MAG TPA: hypothetical protein VFN10_10830 [Thermoanaerobaculia bacterium]|nr:hypothetical protein [Thermoanaerobaculia bacterium]